MRKQEAQGSRPNNTCACPQQNLTANLPYHSLPGKEISIFSSFGKSAEKALQH
jgi:hypothetical protein